MCALTPHPLAALSRRRSGPHSKTWRSFRRFREGRRHLFGRTPAVVTDAGRGGPRSDKQLPCPSAHVGGLRKEMKRNEVHWQKSPIIWFCGWPVILGREDALGHLHGEISIGVEKELGGSGRGRRWRPREQKQPRRKRPSMNAAIGKGTGGVFAILIGPAKYWGQIPRNERRCATLRSGKVLPWYPGLGLCLGT